MTYARNETPEPLAQREPCKGTNCGTTVFNHSPECRDEHDQASDIPEDDFLSGVQACDLSGEGECEACQ